MLHRSQPALMGLEKRQMLFLRAGGGFLPSFKAGAVTERRNVCFDLGFFSVLISGSTSVDSPN